MSVDVGIIALQGRIPTNNVGPLLNLPRATPLNGPKSKEKEHLLEK